MSNSRIALTTMVIAPDKWDQIRNAALALTSKAVEIVEDGTRYHGHVVTYLSVNDEEHRIDVNLNETLLAKNHLLPLDEAEVGFVRLVRKCQTS